MDHWWSSFPSIVFMLYCFFLFSDDAHNSSTGPISKTDEQSLLSRILHQTAQYVIVVLIFEKKLKESWWEYTISFCSVLEFSTLHGQPYSFSKEYMYESAHEHTDLAVLLYLTGNDSWYCQWVSGSLCVLLFLIFNKQTCSSVGRALNCHCRVHGFDCPPEQAWIFILGFFKPARVA